MSRAMRGKTFTILRGMHGDHHGLWIDPANPSILYNVNDGGSYRSRDAGKTWTYDVSAGGIQFYNVTLDTSTPLWAYGSIQDYGSRRGLVDLSKGRNAIPAVVWSNAPGRRRIASRDRQVQQRHRLLPRVLRELHSRRRLGCQSWHAAAARGARGRSWPWPRRA